MKAAYTTDKTPEKVAETLCGQLSDISPRLVLFFASPTYDPQALAVAMDKVFGNIPTVGCATAGEIVSGLMLKNSVVAMGFSASTLADMDIQVIPDIGNEASVEAAMAGFESHFGAHKSQLDHKSHIGIILIDGLSGAEERVMEQVGDMTDVFFIGGSAGDDLKFQKTYVFANGQALSGAAVLVMLKPGVAFDIVKTQSFKETDRKLTATEVDMANREVIRFDDRPASQAYAEAVGTSPDAASDRFMRNPLGLMAGDEPYVRSPQQIIGERIRFYCNVREGMTLSVLESTDILADTRQAVAEKEKEMGGLRGIINFHCILRTLELEDKGLTREYGKIFSDIPTVGFSTYGEQYIGHINQTSTMLVFGK